MDKKDKSNVNHTGSEGMSVVYEQVDADNIYNTNEEILDDVRDRLNDGAKEYGESIRKADPRDFLEELYEELIDAVVYALVQAKRFRDCMKKKDG